MASNQTTLPNVSENEETLLTGVNENVYEDQNIGAELTKKDINRVAWRSMLLQASFNYERMQASGWLYGLLPALKKIHTNKRDLARAMKGHMGFFNTHPFLVTFVIGIILAMERSKQDVNSIQSTKIAVGAPLGGIGDAMFWLTLLPICGGIGASLALQGSILGAVVFIVLFNVVHLGLRFGLAHYAYRMGVAAIPLIKANTKKVGHAASIVGMTVIGALVATYVRLSTTLEITAGDAVVKLQADVIDKLMPAFLPLVYTLTMFWLVRRGLQGAARESALKVLELTAGKLAAFYDSPTGFRHGPKSLVDDETLVVVFVSSHPYTRQYDLDLLAELRRDNQAMRVIAIAAESSDIVAAGPHIILPPSRHFIDVEQAFCFLMYAQTFALMQSLHMGNTPDTPSASGTVNRVVQGVIIHPWQA